MTTVDPDPTLTALALLVVAVALVTVVGWAMATRGRRLSAGPGTMDLGPEPPALVDLVTDRFDLTTEAVTATLLDLAARGWLSVEEPAPGQVVVATVPSPPAESLLPYEQRVLHLVTAAATAGPVPADALRVGEARTAERWWKRFRREVVLDARSRGLSRRRWGPVPLAVAWLGTIGGAALLGVALPETSGDEIATFTPTLVAAGSGLVVLAWVAGAISRSGDERATPAGESVAERWMGVRTYLADHGEFGDRGAASVAVWDRYLAYAAALDLAGTAVRELPLGAEDDRHAWSRHGGSWRQVTVDYRKLRPGWGHHPAWAAVSGLVLSAAFGATAAAAATLAGDPGQDWVLDDIGIEPEGIVWVGRAALAVAVATSLLACWWAVRFAIGVVALFGTRTVDGTLLRKRVRGGPDPRQPSDDAVEADLSGFERWYRAMARYQHQRRRYSAANDHGYQPRSRPRYYLAVDDGSSDTVDAWRVNADLHAAADQGDQVRVRVSPLVGHVRAVTRLAPVPPRPPAPGGSDAPGIEGAPELLAAARRLAASHGRDPAAPAVAGVLPAPPPPPPPPPPASPPPPPPPPRSP